MPERAQVRTHPRLVSKSDPTEYPGVGSTADVGGEGDSVCGADRTGEQECDGRCQCDSLLQRRPGRRPQGLRVELAAGAGGAVEEQLIVLVEICAPVLRIVVPKPFAFEARV